MKENHKTEPGKENVFKSTPFLNSVLIKLLFDFYDTTVRPVATVAMEKSKFLQSEKRLLPIKHFFVTSLLQSWVTKSRMLRVSVSAIRWWLLMINAEVNTARGQRQSGDGLYEENTETSLKM